MQTDLQISWERMEPSDFLRGRIEREVAGLEKTFGRITSCQVFVEGPGHHHKQGGLFSVRVRLELPGGAELAVSRNPPQDQAHEDAYVAVRDVFQALRRRLREYARERRDQPKRPDTQPHGVIAKLLPERNCGFIRTDQGRELYFHRNAVLNDAFDRLRVGAEVHYHEEEEEGENGPQASTVRAFGVGAQSG
jgi:cold shock CspA family protein/ribosome-associated translation inhibitor RaiA